MYTGNIKLFKVHGNLALDKLALNYRKGKLENPKMRPTPELSTRNR